MAFIVRNAQEVARPQPLGKVIRAEDAWAYRTAREAVEAGYARRDEIIAAAVAAFEAEQRRGYREGHEAAKLEQSGNMIEMISQTVDYFAKVEAQMVDLVMEAVRRITNDFDDRKKVEKVVKNSLAMVRNQRQILVKVNPEQAMGIRDQVESFKQAFPGIEQIEVVPEHQLAQDACVIESDIGRVEASMSGQIEALRSTFERVFNASRDHHEKPAQGSEAHGTTVEGSLPSGDSNQEK
jgi:type III secretion protein L